MDVRFDDKVVLFTERARGSTCPCPPIGAGGAEGSVWSALSRTT